jgi:hypothetical protein
VQSGHALIQFSFQHPNITREWHEKSDYLCYLSVDNEDELLDLIEEAIKLDIKVAGFIEPDIGHQVTAAAFEPGEKTKQLCSKLKLALKEYG